MVNFFRVKRALLLDQTGSLLIKPEVRQCTTWLFLYNIFFFAYLNPIPIYKHRICSATPMYVCVCVFTFYNITICNRFPPVM